MALSVNYWCQGAENVQVNAAIAILIDDAGDTIPEVAVADPSASNTAVKYGGANKSTCRQRAGHTGQL